MSLKQRINHKRWRFQKRQKMFTVWKTQNGRRIPVYKMSTYHVLNVIRYFSIERYYGEPVENIPLGVFNPEIQTVMIAELKIRGMLHCLNSAY